MYVYQSCMVTAGLAAFMLPFTTQYWSLIAFSFIYGFSDGIFITSQCFILLTVVDSKRTTAAFCINNLLYSFSAAAGGPIAGEFNNATSNRARELFLGRGEERNRLKC